MGDLSWLLEGVATLAASPMLVGFIVACLLTIIPGPMNAIVIEQTIKKGPVAGLRISIGNSFGVGTAAFISCLPFLFGAAWLATWLEANAFWALLATAVMLLVIGVHMFTQKAKDATPKKPDMGYPLWAYFYTAIYPGNILTFSALVAAMQLGGSLQTTMQALWLVAGFVLGAAVGWSGYLLLLLKFHKKMSPKLLMWMRKVLAGLVIILALLMFIPIINLS